MTTREEVRARLLSTPGGLFEVGTENFLGHDAEMFLNQPSSLGELLLNSGAFGDREYMVADDRRITFAEHLELVHAIARELRDTYGIEPGDRVAIFAFNSPDWVTMFWAVTSIGGVLAAGNSMGVAAEIQHQVSLSTPKLVITDHALVERIKACDLGGAQHAILTDIVEHAQRNHAGLPALPQVTQPDDPAVIIFTSGTTGKPKGSTHSHRNMMTAIWFHLLNDAVATEMGAPPAPRRFLLAGPLFHIASLHNLSVVRCITGDTVVFLTGRFDMPRALALIETERVTNWGAVPTMIARMLKEDLDAYDLSSLKVLTINSAPSSHQLKDEFRARLPHLASTFGTSYGLTESSTAVTVSTPAMLVANPNSVGTPIVTMQIEVRNSEGQVVADGTEGEVHIRGPLVMLGYWTGHEYTGLDEHGWFATGDIGYLDNGELVLQSRRSDLIIRGGQNVYPGEIENTIIEFPHVNDCVVFGVDDEDYGQRVAAVVVTAQPDSFDVAEFTAYLQSSLAKYKQPSHLLVTAEALPLNASGKVIRGGLSTRFPLEALTPLR